MTDIVRPAHELGCTAMAAGSRVAVRVRCRHPSKKIFALSVINVGTAMSSSAKAAAMAEIPKP